MGDKVKVQELDSSTQQLLASLFTGWSFTSFGDVGCIMPSTYVDDADNLRNMAVRPDDVWVVTYPRSGTTWTQEMVWLLNNNLDFDTALKTNLRERHTYVEGPHIIREDLLGMTQSDPAKPHVVTSQCGALASSPSPRFLKSHLHLSILPRNLLDSKVVYVARDPRDVAVSYYHLSRLFFHYTGDFKTFWNLFTRDLVLYSPFFPHLKEAWALRHHENMLFIFYEDMTSDLSSVIKRAASFLGKEITDEETTKLCAHLDIKNFRENKSVNNEGLLSEMATTKGETFIRKGKSGAWREHFDDEMAAQAQRWLSDNLRDTDLRFPGQD